MRKKIILSAIIFLIFFALGTALKVKAGEGQSSRGFIWGGSEDRELGIVGTLNDGNETGMGWISVNSLNCDADKNGFVDVACGGNNNATTPIFDYGVNIPSSGALSGYAWSENLGWIDFGNNCVEDNSIGNDSNLAVGVCVPVDPKKYCAASCTPPGGGTGGVSRSVNNLTGWARVVGVAQESVSGNSGGWEGWIKMNGTNYGVQINSSGDKIIGCSDGSVTPRSCAWNGENKNDPSSSLNIANGFGWVDLSGVSIEAGKALKICKDSCSSGGPVLNGNVVTMDMTDPPINLRACYFGASIVGCNDALADVTTLLSPSDPNKYMDDIGALNDAVDGNRSGDNFIVSVRPSASMGEKEDIKAIYQGSEAVTTILIGCTSDSSYCNANTEPQQTLRKNTCRGNFFPDNCGSYTCPGEKDCTGWIETGPK